MLDTGPVDFDIPSMLFRVLLATARIGQMKTTIKVNPDIFRDVVTHIQKMVLRSPSKQGETKAIELIIAAIAAAGPIKQQLAEVLLVLPFLFE